MYLYIYGIISDLKKKFLITTPIVFTLFIQYTVTKRVQAYNISIYPMAFFQVTTVFISSMNAMSISINNINRHTINNHAYLQNFEKKND